VLRGPCLTSSRISSREPVSRNLWGKCRRSGPGWRPPRPRRIGTRRAESDRLHRLSSTVTPVGLRGSTARARSTLHPARVHHGHAECPVASRPRRPGSQRHRGRPCHYPSWAVPPSVLRITSIPPSCRLASTCPDVRLGRASTLWARSLQATSSSSRLRQAGSASRGPRSAGPYHLEHEPPHAVMAGPVRRSPRPAITT